MWTNLVFNLLLLLLSDNIFMIGAANVGYLIFNFLNLNAGWIHRADRPNQYRPWRAPTWLLVAGSVLSFVNLAFMGFGADIYGAGTLATGLAFAALIVPVFIYRHWIQDKGSFPAEMAKDLEFVEGQRIIRRAGIWPYVVLVVGVLVVAHLPQARGVLRMLITGIKSKPVYAPLSSDAGGRYHLMLGSGVGRRAAARGCSANCRWRRRKPWRARRCCMSMRAPARRQRSSSSPSRAWARCACLSNSGALLDDFRALLERSLMGTRLYVAGPESFIGMAMKVALEFNLNKDEIRAEECGTLARRDPLHPLPRHHGRGQDQHRAMRGLRPVAAGARSLLAPPCRLHGRDGGCGSARANCREIQRGLPVSGGQTFEVVVKAIEPGHPADQALHAGLAQRRPRCRPSPAAPMSSS